MFKSLTDKMSNAMRNLRGLGKISEENIAEALKEVKSALLSADVHFKVVKEFIEQVKEKCLGEDVTKSVSPGEQIIKIISDELTTLLGEGSDRTLTKKPLKIMLVGLHGSGKTTSSVKLAKLLAKDNYTPAMIACDVYRPAAIDQLEALAKQEDFKFYADRVSKNVPKLAEKCYKEAKSDGADLFIFDTAGRLQIDTDLVQEIIDLKKKVKPDEIFLVADSALGQESVNIAKHFHDAVNLTGIILTKIDGDARGGAALSMKHVTGIPILFMGTGEKMDEFSQFHPDRMASRILGMGDVVSLVERAQENIDEEEATLMAEKMRKADFNFEDFLSQLQQVKKMGSLSSIVGMLPGASDIEVGDEEEDRLKRIESIILSMTKKERTTPRLLNGSRRFRIAKGAGVEVKDVNALVKQHSQMRKMMKKMKGSKGKRMMAQMASKMGGGFPGM